MTTVNLGILTDDIEFNNGFLDDANLDDVYAFGTAFTSRIELELDDLTGDADLLFYRDVNRNRFLDSSDALLAAPQLDGLSRERIIFDSLSADDYLARVALVDRQAGYDLDIDLDEVAAPPPGPTVPPRPNLPENLGPQVFRLFDFITGAHFYTRDLNEVNYYTSTLGARNEGVAFLSSGPNSVERFYVQDKGTYFYTISPVERDFVLQNLPNYEFEPQESFAAYAAPVPGVTAPVFRFYNRLAGTHFYTTSELERDSVIANLSNQYNYEGIGYHVDLA